ncbi:hypothetical protein m02_01800, partial [Bartonella bovis m02]
MGGMETLMMRGNVTFEGVTEGININGGGRSGAANVMGMGGTTMTVNGSGVVGIKVQDMKAIDATVMRLKIVGDRSGGKGVEFIGKGGTLVLNMVDVSGFATGVSASKGKLEMMGGSITFASGGTGLNVSGTADAELMGGRIVGGGSNSTGVVMESEGVLMLNMVNISDVRVSGKYGVQMMK